MTVKLLELTGDRQHIKADIKGNTPCSLIQVLFVLE